MCNAIVNSIIGRTALAVALAAGLACCSGSEAEEAGGRLVAQARASLDRGDFDSAFIYLDSLRAHYPSAIEAGRIGLQLRPRAIEGRTQQEIMELQCQIQATAATLDSLMPLFTVVQPSESVVEGYYVASDAPANFRERNTAVARVSPSGEFYMISSLAGNSTRHTAIALSSGASTVRSGNVSPEVEPLLSRESLRFPAAKCDTLGVFAARLARQGLGATLTFEGGKAKSAPSVKLTPKEVAAIGRTHQLSAAMTSLAPMQQRLVQLKAKLQLARDQQANLTDE